MIFIFGFISGLIACAIFYFSGEDTDFTVSLENTQLSFYDFSSCTYFNEIQNCEAAGFLGGCESEFGYGLYIFLASLFFQLLSSSMQLYALFKEEGVSHDKVISLSSVELPH